MNRWYKKDPTPVRRLTNTLQNPTRFARFSIETRPIPRKVEKAGCGRSEEGQYGRTVEAIEQPIAAPASSPVGEPAHTRFGRDVRSRTYGNPSSSCSPGLSTQGLGSCRTRRRLRRHGARPSLCARVHGCVHVGAPSRRACAPACMLQCSLLRAACQQHEWCRGDRACKPRKPLVNRVRHVHVHPLGRTAQA